MFPMTRKLFELPGAIVLLGALQFCTPLPAAAETGYVTGLQTYPLRDTPQFSSPAVERLPVGEKVTIVEEREGWIKVQSAKGAGWMPESVIGQEAPPALQLGPLQKRNREIESSLGTLAKEKNALLDENGILVEKVRTLEGEIEEARSSDSWARAFRRFGGMALGGGLVIFGWITGYALAAISRRKGTKPKYRI